ncbi:MAG: hypothetical protein CMJ17_17070 [Phenylobacterium sp.]|nr:hypothetical protein [Phenylobacterium sp.]
MMVNTVMRASEVKKWVPAAICAQSQTLDVVFVFVGLSNNADCKRAGHVALRVAVMKSNALLCYIGWVGN